MLSESQRFLRAALDALPTHVAILDEVGTIIYVNAAWCRFAETNALNQPDYGLGMNYLHVCERAAGEDAAQAVLMAQRIREIMTQQHQEYSLEYACHSPLEQRWFNVTITRFEDEDRVQVVVSHENITKRKQAEEALLVSEARFRHTLEAMLEGCHIIGFDWRYLYLNEVAEKHNRRSKEDLLGQNYMAMWPGIESTKIFAIIRQCMEECRAQSVENEFTFSDGSKSWFELRIYPVPEGIVILSYDITERKRVEEALRESEDKFKYIFDHSILGKSITFPSGEMQTNRAFCDMFGYLPEELQQQSWQDITHPDDIELSQRMIEALLSGEKEGVRFVKRYLHKNGSVVWGDISTFLRRDQAGQPLYFMTTVSDITEHRQAEESLRASEERYRSLFENMLEGYAYCQMLFEHDQPQDFIYLDVNPAFETLTGLKDVVGKRVSQVIPGIQKTSPKLLEIYARVALTGKPERFEFYLPDLEIWFSLSVFSPAKEYFVTVFDNITERKRAEEELRQSEQRFRQVVSSISDHIYLTRITEDGRHENIYLSPHAEDLTGYPLEKFLTDWKFWPSTVIHPDDRAAAAAQAVQLIRGENSETEYRLVRADGSIIWVRDSGRSERDPLHNATIIYGVISDISKRKVLEGQLVQAQKLEAIGQLAAGIAHEINTPIQYVGDNVGFLQESFVKMEGVFEKYNDLLKAAKTGVIPQEMVAEIEKTVEKVRLNYLLAEFPQAIKEALEGVDRVAKIVRAMKEFSHPGVEEKTAIDINKAIEGTITVARNEWKYVAEVVTDLDPNLPLVPCLPGEFNQVLLNILINAAHAIAEVAGDGASSKGLITITTRRSGDWAEIRIGDTGTGIPEHARTKIFDPFFTTKKIGQGTGQGLAIAYNVIVGKHNGVVTFETEVGRGTTFIIRLPLAPELEEFEDFDGE